MSEMLYVLCVNEDGTEDKVSMEFPDEKTLIDFCFELKYLKHTTIAYYSFYWQDKAFIDG